MAQPWWKPVWSVPAALRTLRGTLVVPSLFAITYKVVGDPQMALFATFGGFATLMIVIFGGTRRDKLVAHFALAVAGSVVLIIGTLASGTTWVAVVVTIPVTFAVFFAGIGGPNAAAAVTGVMFLYVLPVASVGGAATIPSRLEGWWLASAAGTIAVLLMSAPNPGSRLRAAAGELAGELAALARAAADGKPSSADAMTAARQKLRTAFTAAPFRPTGLAAADQALSSLVQRLEWGAAQAAEAFDGHIDLASGCPADRELLRRAAAMFDDTRSLLAGQDAAPDFDGLEAAREAGAEHLRELTGRASEGDARLAASQAVHAQALAANAGAAAAEALAAGHGPASRAARALAASATDPSGIPGPTAAAPPAPGRPATAADRATASVTAAAALVRRHATVRSVWFVNSLRAALAIAAAVAVADVSGVQHGFWVVLGTLSMLRTSAAATGATAWRGLAGTVIGFVVGAALLEGIGTSQPALWAALPVAVAIAAYAPGTTPFLVGQAAFTVVIVVLFNLLQPAGWSVGLLRIEDVALGCAVSLAAGVLFWPRGVSAVVAVDLGDAFRSGAAYLTQSVEWALSELLVPPAEAAAAAISAVRVYDAIRGYLTEQGSKRVSKEDLWALVNAADRLRQTAQTLASLRTVPQPDDVDYGTACLPLAGSEEYAGAPACVVLRTAAASLANYYRAVADELSHAGPAAPSAIPLPALVGPAVPRHEGDAPATLPEHQLLHPHLLWVQENLHHLGNSARTVSEPALHVAEVRQRPWWR
jgi:hypothetical protein